MTQCIRNAVTQKTATVEPEGNEYFQNDRVALSIENVARMFGVSTLTLWIYELRGLVRRERAGRQWVYSWKDCERIALIVKARKAGFCIAKFSEVVKAMDERETNTAAQRGRQQCLGLIHALETQQQTANNALAELNRIDWEFCERLAHRIAEQSWQRKK